MVSGKRTVSLGLRVATASRKNQLLRVRMPIRVPLVLGVAGHAFDSVSLSDFRAINVIRAYCNNRAFAGGEGQLEHYAGGIGNEYPRSIENLVPHSYHS